MAIEHYSSLASNRNYKIHNASERARLRARLCTPPRTATPPLTLCTHTSPLIFTNQISNRYIDQLELIKICVTVYARV